MDHAEACDVHDPWLGEADGDGADIDSEFVGPDNVDHLNAGAGAIPSADLAKRMQDFNLEIDGVLLVIRCFNMCGFG